MSRARSIAERRPGKFLHPAILWLALLPFGLGAWSPVYAGVKTRRRWILSAGLVGVSVWIGGCITLSHASRAGRSGAAAGVGTGLWLASWAIATAAWLAVRGEYGELWTLARASAAGGGQLARPIGSDVSNAPSSRRTPAAISQSDGDPIRAAARRSREVGADPVAPSTNPAVRPEPQRRVAAPHPRAASGEPASPQPGLVVTPLVPSATARPPRAPDARGAWAADWFARLGVRGESATYLQAVATWRAAWRPARVRLLLVAESHVAELPGDNGVVVRAQHLTTRPLPTSFVRLVYCLGYGEDRLCSRPPSKNAGTWQFWDLLGQVALGPGNVQPRKSAATLEARLRWKVTVLETLARRGIWLEDASPIGVGVQPTCLAGGTQRRASERMGDRANCRGGTRGTPRHQSEPGHQPASGPRPTTCPRRAHPAVRGSVPHRARVTSH